MLWNQSAGLDIVLYPPAHIHTDPNLLVQVRGPSAALAHQALTDRVPTFDGHHGMALIDQQLRYGKGVTELSAIAPASADADLVISWSHETILHLLHAAAEHNPELQRALPLVTSLFPHGKAFYNFSPAGITQEIALTQRPAGLTPINPTVFHQLPANGSACYAVGLDGAAGYQAHREAILPLLAEAMNQPSGEDAEAFAHNMLMAFGVSNGISGLCSIFTGDFVVWLGPGALLNDVVLRIPRSTNLDNLLRFAAQLSGNSLPNPGDIGFISFQHDGHRMLAGPLAISQTEDAWLIGSNSVTLQDIIDKDRPGLDQQQDFTAFIQQHPDSCMLGWAESRSGLSSILGLANLDSVCQLRVGLLKLLHTPFIAWPTRQAPRPCGLNKTKNTSALSTKAPLVRFHSLVATAFLPFQLFRQLPYQTC